MIILSVIVTDDQEKLIPYLMEKFQEYQPLIMEFLNNMRKDKKLLQSEHFHITFIHTHSTSNK